MSDKLEALKHITTFKEAKDNSDPLCLELPSKFIIPAGMLLKHMSEADWESMKAFIRGDEVEDDD